MHAFQHDAFDATQEIKTKPITYKQRVNELARTLYETAEELSKLTHCKGVQWETAICLCTQAKHCIEKFEKDLPNKP